MDASLQVGVHGDPFHVDAYDPAFAVLHHDGVVHHERRVRGASRGMLVIGSQQSQWPRSRGHQRNDGIRSRAAAPVTPRVVPAAESRWVPTEESSLRAGRPTRLPPRFRGAFTQLCGGCHSAYGASAISTVPNLFTYVGSAEGTSAAFLAQVRMPTPKMGTMASMPSFPAAMISDADVNQIYEYFKAGTPGAAPTCPSMGGNEMTNLGACSGQALTYSPLFARATRS